MTKAGALKHASHKGIALVCPDTSPRGLNIQGENEHWDFGTGASFYLNATEHPWRENYQMFDYITTELPEIIKQNFNIDDNKMGIFGHSMGGHGALICGLKCPTLFKTVSALAPLCHPVNSSFGKKAFKGYLGSLDAGKDWDACELVKKSSQPLSSPVLIDQGSNLSLNA
ncbi:hypothetical protein Zmor_011866, partial [Zophobas morio]